MHIYIAASHKAVPKAEALRKLLVDQGAIITSNWIRQAVAGKDIGYDNVATEEQRLTRDAQQDIEDIHEAGVLILINDPPSETGGAFTEFGYALALERTCILYGPKTNVFHWHPDVLVVNSEEGLLSLLDSLQEVDDDQS